MLVSKKPHKSKLKACLPGTLIKDDSGMLGVVVGPVEGSEIHIYVRFQSGNRGMMEKETVVDQLLSPDGVAVYLLRMLTIVEEI